MNCLRPAIRNTAILLSAAILLAGCGLVLKDKGPRVRVYDSEQTEAARAPSKQPPRTVVQVNEGGRHVVQRGETLYSIARAYGTPLRTIITANNLKPPYKLNTGQVLTVPQARAHIVQRGETVYAISRRYDIAMSELVRVNNLREPFVIAVGQRLDLPSTIVQQATPAAVQVVARPPDSESTTTTAADRTTFTFKGYPKPVARPELAMTKPQPAQVAAAIPTPAKRSSSKFLWPVQGQLITDFGPTGKGRRNDGLNIAAPRGTPVKAAENGVVAYSGMLQGYGNLVLVKHADGYMTAYAHNGSILVKQGEAVRRGQTIARVGSSGNVDRPQLHFQLRKGKQVLNPKGYLAG